MIGALFGIKAAFVRNAEKVAVEGGVALVSLLGVTYFARKANEKLKAQKRA